MRSISRLDKVINQFDQILRTSYSQARSQRVYPAQSIDDSLLDTTAHKHAAGLMRINHVGEVCAQALYNGQAMIATDEKIKSQLLKASDEETDHLAWCKQRLDELNAKPSLLNPLWYTGSYSMGLIAGLCGDSWSLGFVVETERQVEAHLHQHLETLPDGDRRSRAIVQQMAIDEAQHGQSAKDAGGRELPVVIQRLMTMMANVMKAISYRI